MQPKLARRFLAYEEAAGSTARGATTPAGRVYDKLTTHLTPLIGAAGVQALLARSIKLSARDELASLAEDSVLKGAPKLRDWLETQDPRAVGEAAAVVFDTFFALLSTFIGERLTIHVLRSAWPTVEEPVPNETRK